MDSNNAANSQQQRMWRIFKMHDNGLILAKDFVLCTDGLNKSLVAVGIRGDGVYFFAEPLSERSPPDLKKILVVFTMTQIRNGCITQSIRPLEVAEIKAAYLFNRQKLLNVVEATHE